MSRATWTIGALAAGLLLAGCQQGQTSSWIYKEPFPTTRAELYQKYGIPDAIRVEGADRWLRYDSAEAKGMTLGARYYGVGLVMGRSQSQGDRVWVRVDPDGRITAVEPNKNSDNLHYRLWPFGD
jgi:hypothetical protein